MRKSGWIAVIVALSPASAIAADGPPLSRRPIPQNFKLLTDGHPAARDFRIAPALDAVDAGPGDRPASDLCQISGPDLPREPGAQMKARMSMSLDDGSDAFQPAFSLGGVGGALVRLTDALLDR